MRTINAAGFVIAVALLAGCTVGPDYHRPTVQAPTSWKMDSYWQPSIPNHAPLQLDWWRIFDDTTLGALEKQALANNQTLQAANAHYLQARESLTITASAALPTVSVSSGLARNKISGQRPVLNYATPSESTVQNDVSLRTGFSYELDLFGNVRRDIEAAQAAVEQSADDLANARLVLTANLATDYWAMRELDDEIDVIQKSVDLQHQALRFVIKRHNLGIVSGLDVAQQRSQLDASRTQSALLLKQRAQYEHAISALIGAAAPDFTLPVQTVTIPVPRITLDVPSTLLQRRPDIAAAERAMAESNARIGIATSAYFPDVQLSPSIGWESVRFASMLSAPSLMWSLGSSATQVLFDGGKRRAGINYAKQDYVAAQANYRQTVLDAFRQVQDAVTGLSELDDAANQSHAAVVDAQQLLTLANKRYVGGLAEFLDVISAQQQMLTNRRQEIQIRGQQAALVVYLVQALGGGWAAS